MFIVSFVTETVTMVLASWPMSGEELGTQTQVSPPPRAPHRPQTTRLWAWPSPGSALMGRGSRRHCRPLSLRFHPPVPRALKPLQLHHCKSKAMLRGLCSGPSGQWGGWARWAGVGVQGPGTEPDTAQASPLPHSVTAIGPHAHG